MSFGKFLSVLVVPALLVGIVTVSKAEPIKYTEQIVASGSLGSDLFTNKEVTLTFLGDTSTVTTYPFPNAIVNPVGTATVHVAGLGTATFTDSIAVFDNQQADIAGFTDLSQSSDILDTTNSAFGSYDLTSAIGPTTGSTEFVVSGPLNTTSGGLSFNSTGNTTTFTAAVVPEPAFYQLSTLVILGIGALRMQRKRAEANA